MLIFFFKLCISINNVTFDYVVSHHLFMLLFLKFKLLKRCFFKQKRMLHLHILQKHHRNGEMQPCVFSQWGKYKGPYENKQKILYAESRFKSTFLCFVLTMIKK